MKPAENATFSELPAISPQPSLYYGQVYALGSEVFGVTTLDSAYWLPVAVSCLLQPLVGDTVLFSLEGQRGYILAIVERKQQAVARLQLPAHTQIQAQKLDIQAQQQRSWGHTRMDVWQHDTQVAESYNQINHQSSIKSSARTTHIQGHDATFAQSQRLVIEQDWRVRARDTDIIARQNAILNGKQVRLG